MAGTGVTVTPHRRHQHRQRHEQRDAAQRAGERVGRTVRYATTPRGRALLDPR